MEGFQRGENENLAVGADLENGAAAVAHVQVLFPVESDARGYSHAFHEYRHVAGGRHLVHHAVVAAGDVQHALRIEGHASGIHQFVDERFDG